jgi:hypothetical protein
MTHPYNVQIRHYIKQPVDENGLGIRGAYRGLSIGLSDSPDKSRKT